MSMFTGIIEMTAYVFGAILWNIFNTRGNSNLYIYTYNLKFVEDIGQDVLILS